MNNINYEEFRNEKLINFKRNDQDLNITRLQIESKSCMFLVFIRKIKYLKYLEFNNKQLICNPIKLNNYIV